MIITVVCDIYGKKNNGSAMAAYNLIEYLKAQGHVVRVLCCDSSSVGVPDHYVVPNLNFGKMLNSYVAKVGVSLAKPQKDIIRQAFNGVELVHIMMPLPLGLASVKVAKEMDIPVTAGFHMQAENLTAYFKLNKFKLVNKSVYRYLYDHFYCYCSAIHYPTEFVKEQFETAIGKKTKGYVISNGVNSYVRKKEVQKPDAYKDKIVILSTGRYSTEKRQDVLIKAVGKSKYKDKIQLILGGEGAKDKYYKRLSKKLPVTPVFKFFSRDEMIDVLNYADIYVHPAQIELEGISCIEAIACGKLTIVSDSKLSATRNFAIDDSCVFKANDPTDLAKKLDYWIENSELRKEYQEKYLNSALAFDQTECMRQMEKMLFTCIQNHNGTNKSGAQLYCVSVR